MGVSTNPGAMAFTLMPYLPHSTAMALVMCTTAALLMQYTPICGSTFSPATLAMLMMRPPVKLPGAAPLARASMRAWPGRRELAPTVIVAISPPLQALVKGAKKTWESSVLTFKMLGKMVIGEVSWENITGPITIADYAGKSAALGVLQLGWRLFAYTVIPYINLYSFAAVINCAFAAQVIVAGGFADVVGRWIDRHWGEFFASRYGLARNVES